jgi:hypothetical protein
MTGGMDPRFQNFVMMRWNNITGQFEYPDELVTLPRDFGNKVSSDLLNYRAEFQTIRPYDFDANQLRVLGFAEESILALVGDSNVDSSKIVAIYISGLDLGFDTDVLTTLLSGSRAHATIPSIHSYKRSRLACRRPRP